MVGIKDFGMPSNCSNCEMSSCKGWGHFYCDITLEEIDMDSDERDADCPLVEIKDLEIAKPFIINTLSMLRQDLLDRLAEEKSPYHISDVGIGLEIAIKIIEEYEEKLK